jgi:vacuolar protein sorting-associated protein 3
LTILVHKLRDASSAEAYCTLGGDVIPPKIARSVAEKYGLQQWTTALFPLPVAKLGPTASPVSRQNSVVEGLRTELLKILLEVYMTDEYVGNLAVSFMN